jgi:hypothetical protein
MLLRTPPRSKIVKIPEELLILLELFVSKVVETMITDSHTPSPPDIRHITPRMRFG